MPNAWEDRCRDCDDTGITIQTERRCSCQPAHPTTDQGVTGEVADDRYLLVKRGLYYRPDNRGYTGIKEYAGRYHARRCLCASFLHSRHRSRGFFFAPSPIRTLAMPCLSQMGPSCLASPPCIRPCSTGSIGSICSGRQQEALWQVWWTCFLVGPRKVS